MRAALARPGEGIESVAPLGDAVDLRQQSRRARSPVIAVRHVTQQAIDGVFDRRGLAQAGGSGQPFHFADYRWIGDLQGHDRLPEYGYQHHQYTKPSSKQQVLLREDIGRSRVISQEASPPCAMPADPGGRQRPPSGCRPHGLGGLAGQEEAR
jgi:hypothetical protein